MAGLLFKLLYFGAAAGFSALLLLLAIAPRLLGDEVAPGFSGPELGLCGLDNRGDVPIVIGGDCRAKFQVLPAIVSAARGQACINVAEPYPLGGDITSLANAIRKNPLPLRSHPLIVVSVSMEAANDLDLKNLPFTLALNWSLREHARVAWAEPAAYAAYMWGAYIPSLKRILVHTWKGDLFACHEGDPPYVSGNLAANLGYVSSPAKPDPAGMAEEAKPLRRMLDGANWRNLERSVAWLSRSGASGVVLYNAPLNPDWRRRYPDSEIRRAETRFSAALARLGESYRNSQGPKVRVIDFNAAGAPVFDASLFLDRRHMNRQGAEIFSTILADSIAAP